VPELLIPLNPDGCQRIGISRTGANRLVRKGLLKTVKQGGRRMVSVRALERYVADLERAGGVVLGGGQR
jgi:predicted site-specific integrase-resolvase